MFILKATVRIKTKSGLYPVYIRFTKKTQVSYIKTSFVVNDKGLNNKDIIDPYVIQQTSILIEEYYNQLNHLTSSLRTPKIFIKEFGDFLMSCHQHCLGVNLLVQR